MSEYTPDNWVVIKVMAKPNDTHYRVFAGWSGGYLDGDSWRLNSGIVKVEEDENYYYFYGSSGSFYKCNKDAYCIRNNNAYIWNSLKEKYGDKVEIMPEDTDWNTI